MEIDRIRKLMNETFINFLLSEDEIEIMNHYGGERRLHFVAGRFAVKEAIIKATNEKIIDRKNLSILNDENGAPFIEYKDYNLKLSISHEKNYAVAVAILL